MWAMKIQAFLYLKIEEGHIADIEPDPGNRRWLKVGTSKVNAHGTKLGERFIKKIFDYAIIEKVEGIYVTVFPKHDALIRILTRYGFIKVAEKNTSNGTEDVLIKDLKVHRSDLLTDYPLISVSRNKKYVLSIYPKFHTILFPDSKLFNETYDLVQDVSHTNSIHKIYICFMQSVQYLNVGDLLVMYRTSDGQGAAWYRSIATSICVVEEIRTKSEFESIDEYVKYCEAYSVFDRKDLVAWYNQKPYLFIIKMTYNIALKRRLNRKTLIEDIGINSDYWGFFEITDSQFNQVLEKGEVNEGVIVY